MPDRRLRELERRWRETQAVEDEAAYLLERVRRGDLEQERLELAAVHCHHAASIRALGEAFVEEPILDLNQTALGTELAVRRAIAAAHHAFAHVGELRIDIGRARRAISAAERQVICPCDDHLDQLSLMSTRIRPLVNIALTAENETLADVCDTAIQVQLTVSQAVYNNAFVYSKAAVDSARRVFEMTHPSPTPTLGEPVDALEKAVRLETTSWLLGYSDPIRERHPQLEAKQCCP